MKPDILSRSEEAARPGHTWTQEDHRALEEALRVERFVCVGDACGRPVAYKVAGWEWYLCVEHFRVALGLGRVSMLGPEVGGIEHEPSGCVEVYLR